MTFEYSPAPESKSIVKIDQALLDRLGNAMRDLSHNAEQLKSVSSAASATDSYVSSLEEASKKMAALS